MTTRLFRLLAVVFAAALLLAACGADDSDSSTDTASADSAGAAEAPSVVDASSDGDRGGSDEGDSGDDSLVARQGDPNSEGIAVEAPDADIAPPEDAPAEEEGSDLGSGGSSNPDGPVLTPADLGRDIIFTANISVEVEQVGPAADEALRAVQKYGGFIFNQQTSTEGVNRTVLTFKVRPEDFQAAVSELGGIGELREQSISANDVTERVVNLQSQIITAEASVERLRTFLEGAVGLEEVARLEAQLLERETNLELLKGQLRTIQNQVDLATIVLSLTERIPGPRLDVSQTAYKGIDGGISCQGDTRLSVDEGDAFTVCIVVENKGDTHLGDIQLIDEGFDLDTSDFTVREGDLNELLAPGERLVLTFESEAGEFSTGLETQVSAQVVNADGDDLGVARIGNRGDGFLSVNPNDALPGFLDSLETGLDVLGGIIGVLVILAGLFLPFIWVPVLIWLGLRMLRRWRNNRYAGEQPVYTAAPADPPTHETHETLG